MNDFYTNQESWRKLEPSFLLKEADATIWGTGINIEQFTNVMLEVLGTDSADGTLNIYVSYQDEQPDWTSPVSLTNRYVPVACGNLDTQSAIISGTAGITVADGLTHYIVSLQAAKWLNVEWTRTAGEVSVIVNPYNNQ